MVNGIRFTAECEDCKRKFEVNGTILKNREFEVNGRSIFLTYYDCPDCGRRHFVQVDDVSSKQELTRVSIEFAKLTAAKRKGKAIPQKRSERFKKARQHLSDYRMALMKELTGKLIYDSETGTNFELRFSV